MLKLIGNELKQWELNRRIQLITYPERTIMQATFSKGPVPFAVPIKTEGNVVYVEVPNFMLKDCGTISLETLELDEKGNQQGQTHNFYVHKAEKPADYVYVENEILQLGSGGGGADLLETVGGDTLTWDGTPTETSVTTPDGGPTFYLVSETILKPSDFANGAVVGSVSPMGIGYTELTQEVVLEKGEGCIVGDMLPIAYKDNANLDGVILPKAGIYFMSIPEQAYMSSLKILGYTGFTKTVLKEEYLPDTTKPFVVTFSTEDAQTFTADKTLEDVLNAYKNNQSVLAKLVIIGMGTDTLLYPIMVDSVGVEAVKQIAFSSLQVTGAEVICNTISYSQANIGSDETNITLSNTMLTTS